MKLIKTFTLNIMHSLNSLIIKIIKVLSKDVTQGNTIIKTFDSSLSCYKVIIINNLTLSIDDLIKSVYSIVTTDSDIVKYAPDSKIILTTGFLNNNVVFNFHRNVKISKLTTLKEYEDMIKTFKMKRYNDGYLQDTVYKLEIVVSNPDLRSDNNLWKDVDSGVLNNESTNLKRSTFKSRNPNLSRGYHTYSRNINKSKFSNEIKPLKSPTKLNLKNIIAMDIETIQSPFNSEQIPICITLAYKDNDKIISKFLFADLNLLNNINTINDGINKLFDKLIIELIEINKINKRFTIFTHNLGGFDGYFIFKYLINNFDNDQVKAIVDQHHKFISIELKYEKCNFVWKDSYRIFPIGLDKLCKNFGVDGKTQAYNPIFNNLNFFINNTGSEIFNQFKEYSLRDSIALLECLITAQNFYLKEHNLDLTSILSTSTLSLKIFRQQFLNTDIPILSSHLDNWIRDGYFGGATDYYKPYGKILYYYDVNSLYPAAMLKPMPLKMIKFHTRIFNLDNFFGFCYAEIRVPKNIKIPLLPYRLETGEVIYPTGTFKGIYFSEELKAAKKYGYIVKPINGYEFTKHYLFNDYVKHFYEIKKNSTGSKRFLAKMQLNQLYGYFGRSRELIETKLVFNHEVNKYLNSRLVETMIKINNEKTLLLLSSNVNNSLLIDINKEFGSGSDYKNSFKSVKSNVAIASAVTAYARIEMMKYKTLYGVNVYYSDTDSIFTDKPLPDNLIGKELGQMKDEMDGKIIKEAYFLGIKQYGYQYLDGDKLITKTVFSGVERDSLTFDEIIQLFNGKTLVKSNKSRFYKSFNNLNINIMNDIELTLKKGSKKTIVGTRYVPIHLTSGEYIPFLINKFNKARLNIKRFLNMYKK